MSSRATAARAAQAAALRDEAREHKRLASRHRRQAQILMRRAAALERAGIHLTPTQPPKEGAQS